MASSETNNYTTNLTRATSLKPEVRIVFEKIAHGRSIDELRKMTIEENLLGRTTLRTRRDIFEAIRKRYLLLPSSTIADLARFLTSGFNEYSKDLLIFYFLAKAERLVFDLTINFYYQRWKNSGQFVNSNHVKKYLQSLHQDHPEIEKWSHTTLRRVSQHYLTVMRDFGFAKGSKKKTIVQPIIPHETILFVVLYLIDMNLSIKEIVNAEDFKLFLIEPEDVIDTLNHANHQDLIHFSNIIGIFSFDKKEKSSWEILNEFRRKI